MNKAGGSGERGKGKEQRRRRKGKCKPLLPQHRAAFNISAEMLLDFFPNR